MIHIHNPDISENCILLVYIVKPMFIKLEMLYPACVDKYMT